MKNLFLAASLVAISFASAHAAAVLPANVDLEIVNPTTGLFSETVTSATGLTFTLDIDVQDPTSATTGVQPLGGFDLTLSALPNGLSFVGYSNLVNGFVTNQNSGLFYSASANGMANDVQIGTTAQRILSATFLATASGTYNIDFIGQSGSQELSDGSGNSFNYTDIGNTVTVVVAPEPTMAGLLLVGLAALCSVRLCRRSSL